VANVAEAIDPELRNPKCYANIYGGCSPKISREHFISHSLIKLYSFDDPGLKIRHTGDYGVREFVSPKKFVANVLCEKHNNGLHRADDAALQIATFLRTNSMRFLNGGGEWGDDEEITVSGDDFQAWILKLILNHAVGKALSGDRGTFPPEAIGVMLGLGMWPSTWGLCVSGDTSNKDLPYNPFEKLEHWTTEWLSFHPLIHREGWYGGGIVYLNGIGFGLTVFNPGREFPEFNSPANPLRGSVQRPLYMAWVYRGKTKRINFEWNDVWEHKTLTFTLTD
jgi:hypothetical protein